MDKEVQKLEKWCLNLIDNFRKLYEKLQELEKNQVYINYSAPSQIEIFWVSEPFEYQLFVLLHDRDRTDKEIIINGPFRGFQLEEEVIKIMDEPRWKKVIPDMEDNFLWDYEIVGKVPNFTIF